MLSTFKLVGTKTPENVFNFSVPPMGLGKAPFGAGAKGASLLSLNRCICAVKYVSSSLWPGVPLRAGENLRDGEPGFASY